MAKPALLEMKGITKKFENTLANDHIDLSLYPGEIHALLGENGSGKSTLMNILLGIYKPNTGEILYQGERVHMKSPKTAADLHIGMVHQHFALIPTLTVAENIFLSMSRCAFFLNQKKMEDQIRAYSEKFALPVDPGAKVWQLSVGEQQRVEIMKLLCRNSAVLVLDEPTAVLTPQEAGEMFKTLRKMANDGKSVIFISHKMNEVMAHADRITVLKNGKVEDEMLAAEATIPRLTKAVVGARGMEQIKLKPQKEQGNLLLEAKQLRVFNDKGLVALHDISFQLHTGEILAIAGVAGSGQRELAEALAGLRKVTSGSIVMSGADITKTSAKDRISRGIAFIPEDRLKMGLIPGMNMKQNTILKEFSAPAYSTGGILRNQAIAALTERHVQAHAIKHGGLDLPVSLMSGGNQQKLLIAREINGDPTLIIAAYPVRGLDIGATEAIHRILLAQRDRGACVLLISEELDEIFAMSDRVAVLCDGTLMGIRHTAETNYDEIGRLMSGASL
ncbi:ABC transporter ATP-binding protein [Dehalobacter sp. DCM]|uniref:ABC transporter ATP-binding protein n=1 Tax=Dehalobacter sp. DCM TaxID=2907827 RepID=UPI0030816DA0|nr:ABC transporter ATP-binding protein [Dehalobacter sp. DCM]